MRKSLLLMAVLGTFAAPAAVWADDAAPAADAAAPAADAAAPAAAPAAPAAPVLNGPGMNFPLTGSASPLSFDAGPVGKVYVSGVVSAIGLLQDSPVKPVYGQSHNVYGDFSNAQIILQKIDGLVQFYVEGGGYSIPTIGVPYTKASKQTDNSFGVIPTAYIKIAPTDSFNVMAGKLPTLQGAEYTFTFENTNIERGLLWNQENVFTRGVQANYTAGPLAVSASVTDGFYSKDYKWLTGLVSYTINDSNAITLVASGNVDKTTTSGYNTPLAQNNGQVYNLIYKYTNGPLTLQPYLQYTYVPSEASLGITKSTSTYGAALLANYMVNSTVNIGARAEYIGSDGSSTDGSQNLLGYGAGSDAWSFTITPTYQDKAFFARAELSYVKANSITSGLGFGSSGNDSSQSRLVVETGFMF